MSLRVSTSQIADSSLFGINEAYTRFSNAERKINTGKQLQKPSDDPSGLAQSLDLHERVSELDQYGRTLDQAKGFLSTSETALGSVNSLLRQARSAAVQGATDSTSQETRIALAGQIQNIITQIGNLGNASFGSRYVFAGQRTSAPPFQAAGQGFNYSGGTSPTGDADISLDIGRGDTLKVNVTGDQVLSPILTSLGKLRDDIATGASETVSRDDLADLDTQITNVVGIRADFGSKINRIDQTRARNDLTKVNFTQFISNIEDTDIPKAVVELQTAQTAYQAALQATARSFQTSLLDFLR